MYKILEIKINGPFGSNYDLFVDFKDKKAIYKKQDAMFLDMESFNINIKDEELEQFIAKLDQYEILSWKDEYKNPDFSSGYKWNLFLVQGDAEKKVEGLVQVPDDWDELCKAITILIGRKFA